MVLRKKYLSADRQEKGFTLVEILVAVAIFSIVVSVAIGIFVMAMKSQRKILAQQQLLDQTSYVMEYMSRAIRMARKDLTGSCIGTNLNYLLTHSGQGIKFKNYNGICQEFYLYSDGTLFQLKENKAGVDLALTSPNLIVKNFIITSSGWGQDDNLQPATTMFLDIADAQNLAEIKIQTTISQRNLDVEY